MEYPRQKGPTMVQNKSCEIGLSGFHLDASHPWNDMMLNLDNSTLYGRQSGMILHPYRRPSDMTMHLLPLRQGGVTMHLYGELGGMTVHPSTLRHMTHQEEMESGSNDPGSWWPISQGRFTYKRRVDN